MHSYISDTEFAVSHLTAALVTDRAELAQLEAEQAAALSKEAYFDIAFMQRQMHPSANYWYGQLREAQGQRNALDSEIARIEARLLDKKFSLSALASALLQIGKQGISVVRRHPASCPDGRAVCGVPLKWVIWAGRNQALHYEEPRMINDETQDYLHRMGHNSGNAALLNSRAGENLALAVVEQLGWLSFAAYQEDMQSLLG
ncbi:hypothetical protein [Methyloversatilis discipulorum]|uniref:hypothetical protein n=1 Tax=Methyloversatilis discipulorum TaxID=1119528 RepID=UPI0012F89754|nr:hypothetical protein [Methyloversatilis discipulorum]